MNDKTRALVGIAWENERLKARVKELLSGSAGLTAKGNAYLDRAEAAEARVAELETQLASTLAGLRELADAGLITESRAAEIAGVRIEDLRACDATGHGEWTAAHLTRIVELQEKLRALEADDA